MCKRERIPIITGKVGETRLQSTDVKMPGMMRETVLQNEPEPGIKIFKEREQVIARVEARGPRPQEVA